MNTEKSEDILVKTYNEYEGIVNPGTDDPSVAVSISQYEIDRHLESWTHVYRMVWKRWQQFGDAKQLFRVTGLANAPVQTIEKGDPAEDYQVMLSFDVQSLNQEAQTEKFKTIAQIAATFDKYGQIDSSKLVPLMVRAVDPAIAEQVVLPKETGTQQVVDQVQNDITQMSAGINKDIKLGTPPQTALAVLQQYLQSPDVQQRMMTDQAFEQRITKYAKQLQFQQTQQQNAKIGRFGA